MFILDGVNQSLDNKVGNIVAPEILEASLQKSEKDHDKVNQMRDKLFNPVCVTLRYLVQILLSLVSLATIMMISTM